MEESALNSICSILISFARISWWCTSFLGLNNASLNDLCDSWSKKLRRRKGAPEKRPGREEKKEVHMEESNE